MASDELNGALVLERPRFRAKAAIGLWPLVAATSFYADAIEEKRAR